MPVSCLFPNSYSPYIPTAEHDLALHDSLETFTYGLTQSFAEKGCDDTFLVCDIGYVVNADQKFTAAFPSVRKYFQTSISENSTLLQLVSQLGCNFACHDKAAVKRVLTSDLNGPKIYFSSPGKTVAQYKHIGDDSDLVVFDSSEDLYRIERVVPNAKLMLRVDMTSVGARGVISDCHATFDGCEMYEEAASLFKLATILDMDIVGISLHCVENLTREAICEIFRQVDRLFKVGARHGHTLRKLDLGDAVFMSDNFDETASWLNAVFSRYFPEARRVELVAQVGGFYTRYAFSLCAMVLDTVAAGMTTDSSCYVNDSVFESFADLIVGSDARDGLRSYLRAKPVALEFDNVTEMVCINGSSYDDLDCIILRAELPRLKVGDWIRFDGVRPNRDIKESRELFFFSDKIIKPSLLKLIWPQYEEEVPSDVDVEITDDVIELCDVLPYDCVTYPFE